MIATLKGTLRVLSETVLPAGTPAVEPIPASMDATATVASRKRLEGSIVKCSGDKYLLIPPGSSKLSATSRKIPMSISGDDGDAIDRTEAALATLNPEGVMIGILTSANGSGTRAGELKVAGLPVEVRAVADASGFATVAIAVAGGDPVNKPIGELEDIIGEKWVPWGGSPAAPPPLPAIAGVPLLAAAASRPIGAGQLLGTGAARALRTASLGIMGVALANCGDSAAFLHAIAPSDEASIRALTAALAASAVDADPADGPGLLAVRAAAADVDASLQPIVDSLDSTAVARVVSGAAALTAVHLAPGITQLGSLVAQAVASAVADAAAKAAAAPPSATAPAPAPPGPGGVTSAVTAAVAAAMGTATVDLCRAEAQRRFAALGMPLSANDERTAVDRITAALAASGFVPPVPSGVPAPGLPSGSSNNPQLIHLSGGATTFTAVRIAGSDAASAADVMREISTVFGKSTAELAEMLARAAGRDPPDPFFASDVDFEARSAAAAFDVILGATRFEARPANWREAAHRLRDLVTVCANKGNATAATGAVAGHPAPDPPRSQVKGASGAGNMLKVGIAPVCSYGVSSAANVVGILTNKAVLLAEACAARLADPVLELRRATASSYGEAVRAHVISDGTSTGSLPEKGTFPPLEPQPNGLAARVCRSLCGVAFTRFPRTSTALRRPAPESPPAASPQYRTHSSGIYTTHTSSIPRCEADRRTHLGTAGAQPCAGGPWLAGEPPAHRRASRCGASPPTPPLPAHTRTQDSSQRRSRTCVRLSQPGSTSRSRRSSTHGASPRWPTTSERCRKCSSPSSSTTASS